MGKCFVCKSNITRSQPSISCTECKGIGHANCVGMSSADIDFVVSENQIWRCPHCAKERRKSMAISSAAESGTATMADVIYLLEEAKEERKRMEADLGASIELCHGKIDDNQKLIASQNEKLEKYFKIVEDMKTENIVLKNKIKELEERIDESEQYSRANSIEINGVPEKKDEKIEDIIKTVGTAVGMDITSDRIDVCHRLGKRRGDERPASIIVKFVRRTDKQMLLQKKKAKNNLTANDLGYQVNTPIYINQSLSPLRRKLLRAAKEKKRERGFAFVWASNDGKILVRKEEGGPVTHVKKMDDIINM